MLVGRGVPATRSWSELWPLTIETNLQVGRHRTETRRAPAPRRPAWVERVLSERIPPPEGRDWQQYDDWQRGRLTIPGLPDARCAEGQQLLREMRVSLR
jgi:hypothetical protein